MNYLAEATGSGRYPRASYPDPWMTWDMVREMLAQGMEIGGHTVHHPVLSRMPCEAQFEEIAQCVKRLYTELGQSVRAFSYPVGKPSAFNEDTRACLKRVGIDFAFSYYGGLRREADWDPYDIRRVAIESDIGLAQFRSLVRLPQMLARPAVS
jgi:peptidoglycan/xylan/chitin deacetylase (PgdA/CDA1 family)